MTDRQAITDADLHALLDGELDGDPAGKARVETSLDANPALTMQFEADREIAAAIDRAGRDVEAEAVPHRLTALVERDTTREILWRRSAVAASLVLALMAGWWAGRETYPAERLTELARGPVLFPASDQDAAPADPDAPHLDGDILNQLESDTSRLSELDRGNLRLTRVSTHAAGGRYVRELGYTDRDGHRISVLVSLPEAGSMALPRTSALSGRPLVYWTQGRTVVGITGDVAQDELNRIARDVRTRLSTDRPHPRETGEDMLTTVRERQPAIAISPPDLVSGADGDSTGLAAAADTSVNVQPLLPPEPASSQTGDGGRGPL